MMSYWMDFISRIMLKDLCQSSILCATTLSSSLPNKEGNFSQKGMDCLTELKIKNTDLMVVQILTYLVSMRQRNTHFAPQNKSLGLERLFSNKQTKPNAY